jgi:pSer/pThr/pTyr-binding forkhead associated (FHA) protein
MSLTLVVQDKEGNTTQYSVDSKPEVVLGRAAEVDVPLLSKNVSRKHAKLRFQGKKILIEDLGSSNGVLVNGAKIVGPTEVLAGSEFQIGEFTVKITSQEPETSQGSLGSLIGQNGAFLDKILTIKAGDNIVGRGSECDVFVADGSISRRHAILTASVDKFVVRDMGSANGTFVNGQKIQDITPVRSGEVVRFGSLSFRLELAGAPSQPLSKMAGTPQPIAAKASAPQPIAAKVSAPQPIAAKVSAPQPISKPKVANLPPLVAREPSGAAAISSAASAEASALVGDTDWLKVGALLATPLIFAFFFGVVGWRLFGGSSDDSLKALRAQMMTSVGVESAVALKGQNSFIEAEAALLPVLQKNPGEPTARALFNTVHDEADNQRALQEAIRLKDQKNHEEALTQLSKIEENSAFAPDATKLAQELQTGSLVSDLRGAADACEAENYSECLTRICAYIDATGETDPEIVNLARVAYGLTPQASDSSKSCRKDKISPTLAEKEKAEAEKLYASDPRKGFILAYFDGQTAQETAAQLQEAAIGAESAANKKLFEETASILSSVSNSLGVFAKRVESGNVDDAEKVAKAILENEKKLFKSIESPVSADIRKRLLVAYAKSFAKKTFSSTAEFQEGKEFIKKMAAIDSNNNSPLRFAMAVRYQAALREVFEKSIGKSKTKDICEVLLPFTNNKSKLKEAVQAKLSELSPK